MESPCNDRRFRDLLGRGGGMAFPSGYARQDVFNILALFRGGHEKNRFDPFKLIQAEPIIVVGNDVLFPLLDGVCEGRGEGGKHPFTPWLA